MKKEITFAQICREGAMRTESTPGRHPVYATYSPGEGVGRYSDGQRGQKAHRITLSAFRVFRWIRAGGIGVLAVAAAACTPLFQKAQEVEAKPPRVSYVYSSDAGLIEANSKARIYCGQYASTSSSRGSITQNPDGTKTVTFECIKTGAVTSYPPPPMSYSYRTDTELLQAIDSADADCARSGQTASSSIVTNPDGTKTLMFQCVSR
jgi:hypothetical protein